MNAEEAATLSRISYRSSLREAREAGEGTPLSQALEPILSLSFSLFLSVFHSFSFSQSSPSPPSLSLSLSLSLSRFLKIQRCGKSSSGEPAPISGAAGCGDIYGAHAKCASGEILRGGLTIGKCRISRNEPRRAIPSGRYRETMKFFSPIIYSFFTTEISAVPAAR